MDENREIESLFLIMKRFVILVFIILVTSCFKNKQLGDKPLHALCENPGEQRTCPKNREKIFLPRTFPARAIYVGYTEDDVHRQFLDQLIKVISELEVKPMINVMIPRFEEHAAYEQLKKYFSKFEFKFVNFIPTASNETVWAQDYFEILFDTKTGYSEIVDLPYYGREGDFIPQSIALSCQKELISQAEYSEENPPGNGDYGGNIEALTTDVVMIGNNISNETMLKLTKVSKQKFVEVDVSWLETGHVDELMTTLPLKKNAKPCEQNLLVASPKLGLELIDQMDPKSKPTDMKFMPFHDDYDHWPDSQNCLYPKDKGKPWCQAFRRANETYQRSIEKSVERVQVAIESVHGCRLKEEYFPQLFSPLSALSVYGTLMDRSIALNPNSVNNIFFYPNLFLAKQTIPSFQKAVDDVLKKYPYKIHFADGKFVHELNGGIHCATNVSYSCSP